MTSYGIIGDVEASPKLVRAALSDLLKAHQLTTPDGDFWLNIGVRNAETVIHDEILDWASRNQVYVEVVTPAKTYQPYLAPNRLTVSPSFMLDVVESMRHTDGGMVLALVGDKTPSTDVLRALAKAKDNGTEIRDLAEAGLSLIRFKGDDPPQPLEDNTMPDEETVDASFPELGEYADDDSDVETAEQAQKLLTDAAGELGIDPDEYATWAEVATAIEEASGEGEGEEDEGEEDEDEEDEPEEEEGLTRESLVGKDIGEIKALAKAAGIEGYSKMRREPLIKELLGEEDESSAPAAPAAKARKATGAAKKQAASSPANDGDAGPGGPGITEQDVDRIANAVVARLAASLSAG